MENHFVDSIYAKAGKHDFIVAELGVNVEKTIDLLSELKAYAKNNKGMVNMSILKSKKDSSKFYIKYVLWDNKPEVTAAEQMPDREDDDLPF